jgi:hypothetical protein
LQGLVTCTVRKNLPLLNELRRGEEGVLWSELFRLASLPIKTGYGDDSLASRHSDISEARGTVQPPVAEKTQRVTKKYPRCTLGKRGQTGEGTRSHFLVLSPLQLSDVPSLYMEDRTEKFFE